MIRCLSYPKILSDIIPEYFCIQLAKNIVILSRLKTNVDCQPDQGEHTHLFLKIQPPNFRKVDWSLAISDPPDRMIYIYLDKLCFIHLIYTAYWANMSRWYLRVIQWRSQVIHSNCSQHGGVHAVGLLQSEIEVGLNSQRAQQRFEGSGVLQL